MMKKRFSIRYKLILIFGILVTVACITEGLVAIIIAHKAVTEKIQVHLMDKARDAAEILDGKVLQWFQLLDIGRNHTDASATGFSSIISGKSSHTATACRIE